MKDEPEKSRQHNISEINDDLIEMQSVFSQLSYLTSLLEKLDTDQIEEFNEIFQVVKFRMNPELHQKKPHISRFMMLELKPLIWLVEPK